MRLRMLFNSPSSRSSTPDTQLWRSESGKSKARSLSNRRKWGSARWSIAPCTRVGGGIQLSEGAYHRLEPRLNRLAHHGSACCSARERRLFLPQFYKRITLRMCSLKVLRIFGAAGPGFASSEGDA